MIVPTREEPQVVGGVRRVTPVKAGVAAAVVGAAVLQAGVADAAIIDKWWSGRYGSFASANWATQHTKPQTLRFDTCSHDWSPTWGDSSNVVIELVEVQAWNPDVVQGSWKYGCRNAVQSFTSGNTNPTNYHFDFEPNVAATTSGTMRITHSV